MSDRLKQNIQLLQTLTQSNPKVQRALIREGGTDLVHSLCEICLNILKSNIDLTTEEKKALKKHKNIIRYLAKKKNSITSKRKFLLQKGGGIFLALLAPLIGSLISKLASS